MSQRGTDDGVEECGVSKVDRGNCSRLAVYSVFVGLQKMIQGQRRAEGNGDAGFVSKGKGDVETAIPGFAEQCYVARIGWEGRSRKLQGCLESEKAPKDSQLLKKVAGLILSQVCGDEIGSVVQ
jgi:hypothetical protein